MDDSLARRDWDRQPGVADFDTMTRRLLADFQALQPAQPA